MLLTLLLAVVLGVLTLCFIAFAIAGRIEKVLGQTGNTVVSRLLGVMLAALAVQYVIDGTRIALSS